MIKLIVKKQDNILKYLTEYEGLGFNKIQALFRKKDVKVNNKKADSKQDVNVNDEILLFANSDYFFNIPKIFEDENIIILYKPKKLEVVSETKNISLINLINPYFYAVHRIDFNTEGLVVLAKNLLAKEVLDYAFAHSLIEKHYITICKNYPKNKSETFSDFLIKKDGFVEIYNKKIAGSKRVITQINELDKNNGFSLIDVNLLTGRTHQIRAHLAFHNLPVIGDDKYGDYKTNKKLNLKNQVLKCYEIKFSNLPAPLDYLSNKIFKTNYNNILKIFETL